MKIISPLPNAVYLACSGGSDSMFALHFLSRVRTRKIIPLYFNHNTDFGNQCESFLKERLTNVIIGSIRNEQPKGTSLEEFWRQERYSFFDQYTEYPIITCHHLDDQLETMVMGFCHGRIRKIPYRRDNYLRPFLNVSKEEILEYCSKHSIEYLDDPSNYDTKYCRNRVRHNIIPELLKINPGLYKALNKL